MLIVTINNFEPNLILININKLKLYMYVEELVTKTNQQLHLLMIMCSCLGTLGV
jgi:hypothetical protein